MWGNLSKRLIENSLTVCTFLKWLFILTPTFFVDLFVPIFFLFAGIGWVDFKRKNREMYYGHIFEPENIKLQLLY